MADFIDRVRIHVKGGSGGAGVAGFERIKGRPRGRPTGGSGGHGGNVVVAATADVATLVRYHRRPHWTAEDGTHGQGDLRHGRAGTDLVLDVPLGTMVHDESGTLLADLVEPGQRVIVAAGGRGGRGNAALVDVAHRAPSYAEQGEYGESNWVDLDLRLIADAALIGFPNAGKSTLISRISAAQPKIADYPFTTLTPNLGVVVFDDRDFVVADIPGLIEGASEGKGLGHEFLRHTERARVLVMLLDPTPVQERPYTEQYTVLRRELERHSADLAEAPYLVVLNKVDAVSDTAEAEAWAGELGIELHLTSGITGDGLDSLIHEIANEVDRHVREAPGREGYVLHRPGRVSFEVTRDGDGWVVIGRSAERAANLDDLTVPEAADVVAQRLARLGVDDALAEAGARPGDDVRIGDIVFTFEPDAVTESEPS